MDCGNENIIEEEEETNMAPENLEIFKREFTSHFGVPSDFIHSAVQGMMGILNGNAESEEYEEDSGESEES